MPGGASGSRGLQGARGAPAAASCGERGSQRPRPWPAVRAEPPASRWRTWAAHARVQVPECVVQSESPSPAPAPWVAWGLLSPPTHPPSSEGRTPLCLPPSSLPPIFFPPTGSPRPRLSSPTRPQPALKEPLGQTAPRGRRPAPKSRNPQSCQCPLGRGSWVERE